MKEKEIKLENIEASPTLGGAGEARVQGRGSVTCSCRPVPDGSRHGGRLCHWGLKSAHTTLKMSSGAAIGSTT